MTPLNRSGLDLSGVLSVCDPTQVSTTRFFINPGHDSEECQILAGLLSRFPLPRDVADIVLLPRSQLILRRPQLGCGLLLSNLTARG